MTVVHYGQYMSGDLVDPLLRQAVRAVLLDQADNILLVHSNWPELQIPDGFWACPGGGVEEDETPIEALRRELREEVGFELAEAGPAIWRSRHLVDLPDYDGQEDTYYLVRAEHFIPAPRLTPAQLLTTHVRGQRWWSLDEIDAGQTTFAPRRLGDYLRELIKNGPPEETRWIEMVDADDVG